MYSSHTFYQVLSYPFFEELGPDIFSSRLAFLSLSTIDSLKVNNGVLLPGTFDYQDSKRIHSKLLLASFTEHR